jgi:hypothetical protein
LSKTDLSLGQRGLQGPRRQKVEGRHPDFAEGTDTSLAYLDPSLHAVPCIATLQLKSLGKDHIIKCICSNGKSDDWICSNGKGDDWATLCFKCNTWQHVSCYYQDGTIAGDHLCAKCHQRQRDVRPAIETQKRPQGGEDAGNPVGRSDTGDVPRRIEPNDDRDPTFFF